MRLLTPAPLGAGVVAVTASTVALACANDDKLKHIHYAIRPAVVRILTMGPGDCSTSGAGFFISSSGLVMTGRHLVPPNCPNQGIVVSHEGNLDGYPAEVVERSSTDIAILKLVGEVPDNLPFLELDLETPEEEMLGQQVIVSSFPETYEHSNFTSAKIDAVKRSDDDIHWMLCGPAANPGRSGSAVVTTSGLAAAVFVARPGDKADPMQDIAKVVPIRRAKDITLERPTGGVGMRVGKVPDPNSVAYAYPIRITLASPPWPWKMKGRTRVKRSRPEFRPVTSFNPFRELKYSITGWELKYEERYALKFDAFPGYRFDPAGIKLVAESHNPPYGPRPDKPCAGAGEEYQDCYILSEDKRQITLRLRLWQGYIGNATRGWFGGELQTFQVRG